MRPARIDNPTTASTSLGQVTSIHQPAPYCFSYRAFPPWSLVVSGLASKVRATSSLSRLPFALCPLRLCLPFNCPHVHSTGARRGAQGRVGDENGPPARDVVESLGSKTPPSFCAAVIPAAGVKATRDRIVCPRCHRPVEPEASCISPLHGRPSLVVPSSRSHLNCHEGSRPNRPYWFATWDWPGMERFSAWVACLCSPFSHFGFGVPLWRKCHFHAQRSASSRYKD